MNETANQTVANDNPAAAYARKALPMTSKAKMPKFPNAAAIDEIDALAKAKEAATTKTARDAAKAEKTAETKLARMAKREAAKSARAAILETAPTTEKVPVASAVIHARMSLGTELTWLVPEIRAKRAQRSAVLVNGESYKSVRDAFTALNLPDCKHIAFRGKLKAAGELEGFGFTWKIVPLNY